MTAAAIYARVSSSQQAKHETIGSQLAALRDLAAQGCLDVVLVYSPDRLAASSPTRRC